MTPVVDILGFRAAEPANPQHKASRPYSLRQEDMSHTLHFSASISLNNFDCTKQWFSPDSVDGFLGKCTPSCCISLTLGILWVSRSRQDLSNRCDSVCPACSKPLFANERRMGTAANTPQSASYLQLSAMVSLSQRSHR